MFKSVEIDYSLRKAMAQPNRRNLACFVTNFEALHTHFLLTKCQNTISISKEEDVILGTFSPLLSLEEEYSGRGGAGCQVTDS